VGSIPITRSILTMVLAADEGKTLAEFEEESPAPKR
jgi:hypothetical protein